MLLCLGLHSVFMPRSPPPGSPAVHLRPSSLPNHRPFWSASLLTRVRQLTGFCRSHTGMRSQTNAMPLSVLSVPEGAEDYGLIPVDFGPWSRREEHRGVESQTPAFTHSDAPGKWMLSETYVIKRLLKSEKRKMDVIFKTLVMAQKQIGLRML